MALGSILLGVSFLVMVAGAQLIGAGKGSLFWPFFCTFLLTIGEVYLSPTGLSLVTKASPTRIVSMMMGFWLGSSFFGNYLSGWLGTFYDDAKDIFNKTALDRQILRLIAKVPTLAAMAYRFSSGLPFVQPDNSLSYSANFLNMMFKVGNEDVVDPVLARAMDILFILHADHEQNCGTTAMRVVASSNADPYSAAAAASAALYGPLHGGANEAVVRMLEEIGSLENVPAFIQSVKDGKGRLMGFGHRVYKNYDPRATIIKKTAYDVFAVTGKNPLLDIALKLEEAALADDYFVSRKLYPNVDFYSGLIYQALGFPVDMFTVLFAIPRTAGWLTHFSELLGDKEQKISRPRQWYKGPEERNYVPIAAR
jgi:citrate synthase